MARLGAMIVRDVPPHELTQHIAPVVDLLDELWVVEDLGWAGGVAQAATLLEQFPDVTVGHGIAPAPFRHRALLAMEWAALAARHPGRFHGGIGHGLPPWMAQLSLDVASPLTLLEETTTTVRALLAGQRAGTAGRYVTASEVGLEFLGRGPAEAPARVSRDAKFPPRVVPPVSLGVRGPRSLELSGRCADGTILSEWSSPDYVRWARTRIDHGRAANGRDDLPPHHLTVFCGVFLADSTAQARAAMHDTAAAMRERADQLRTVVPDHDGDPPAIDEILQVGGAVGNPDDVLRHVRAVIDAGADTVVLVPFGNHPASMLARAVPLVAGT